MAILSQITTILLDKGNFPQGIMLLSTAIGTVGQQMSGSNANITISVLKVMEAMSESMMLYDISYFDEDEVYNKPEYNFLV